MFAAPIETEHKDNGTGSTLNMRARYQTADRHELTITVWNSGRHFDVTVSSGFKTKEYTVLVRESFDNASDAAKDFIDRKAALDALFTPVPCAHKRRVALAGDIYAGDRDRCIDCGATVDPYAFEGQK